MNSINLQDIDNQLDEESNVINLNNSPDLLLIKTSSFEEKCINSSDNKFIKIEGDYANFEAYRRNIK